MTNAEAIAYLEKLPPDDVAPLRTVCQPDEENSTRWQFGRVEIAFPAYGKYAKSAFLLGKDAEITVDGKPLDIGFVTAIDIHIERDKEVILDIKVAPQPLEALPV